MRSFVYFAGLNAGLALLCAGCKPEAPSAPDKSAARGAKEKPPQDKPKEQQPAVEPVVKPAHTVANTDVKSTPPKEPELPKAPKPRPDENLSLKDQIKKSMWAEAQKRLDLDAETDPVKRASLKREIEEIVKARMALYDQVGGKK